MKLEQLAEAQLWAAWVAAGAAVIQAVGAVTAIVASIFLARGSAARERAAEAAAAERERRANEAAERRATEAHQLALDQIAAGDAAARRREAEALEAAAQRSAQAKAISWNEHVDAASTLMARAIATLRTELKEWNQLAGASGMNYGGGSSHAMEIGEVGTSIIDLRQQTPVDAPLREMLSSAAKLLHPRSLNWGLGTAAEMSARVHQRISRLEAIVAEIKAQRVF